jgi:hypothetical protein
MTLITLFPLFSEQGLDRGTLEQKNMAPLSMKPLNVHLFSMEQILVDMRLGPVRHGKESCRGRDRQPSGDWLDPLLSAH